MKHRRSSKTSTPRESLVRLLFLLLLFLSVLRVIDLLPAPNGRTEPAFLTATPMPESSPEMQTPDDAPSTPEPLRIDHAETSVLSQGLDLRGKEPKILIYHTHTTEAYTATESSPYVQTSAYRTADAEKNVLAVGEVLAQRLRTEYGFAVIHDTTNHEPPSLKTAYERSEQTMCRYLEEFPSLILFIDLHRDAGSNTSDYVIVDDCPTARIMCVVGQGTNYAEKPNFDRNYALAAALTDNLRLVEKRLARDVRVKTGRYNQHVGQMCLLIEVGHNANTLDQAMHAVPLLAESLALAVANMDTGDAAEPTAADFYGLWIPDRAGIDKE